LPPFLAERSDLGLKKVPKLGEHSVEILGAKL
jgi:hypothetical protein